MKVSSVNNHQPVKTGKKIGTIAGAGAGSLYIAKNYKDTIANRIKEATEIGKTSKEAKAAVIIASALSVGGLAVAGNITGGVIGKLVDKHNTNKNDNKSHIGKIAKATAALGVIGAGLAVAHKTGSFDKVAGKLTGKLEVFKPAVDKMNKAGEVILNKTTDIFNAAKSKVTTLELDKKAASIFVKGKEALSRVKEKASSMLDKLKK